MDAGVGPQVHRSGLVDPGRVDETLNEADGERSLLYLDGYHLGWAARQVARAKAAGCIVHVDPDGAPDTIRRQAPDASLHHARRPTRRRERHHATARSSCRPRRSPSLEAPLPAGSSRPAAGACGSRRWATRACS